MELEIATAANSPQLAKWLQDLRNVPSLRVLALRGSESGCTRVVVDNDRPVPLLSIIKGMSTVKDATKNDGNIHVVLE
jgi:superfamily II RNA helicase